MLESIATTLRSWRARRDQLATLRTINDIADHRVRAEFLAAYHRDSE